jgi:hypothetical protein
VDDLLGDNVQISLKAGYQGLRQIFGSWSEAIVPEILKQIFIGDVKRVKTHRNGPDLITEIEAGDGEKAITEKHKDKSYGPGTPVNFVIADLAAELGLAVGAIKDTAVKIFKNGFTLSGSVRDNLEYITKLLNVEWTVSDNELVISAPNKDRGVIFGVNVTKETGLIGWPSQSEKGVVFNKLLDPEIKPKGLVTIDSEQVSGRFVVRTVNHVGDTRGAEWVSKVECIKENTRII